MDDRAGEGRLVRRSPGVVVPGLAIFCISFCRFCRPDKTFTPPSGNLSLRPERVTLIRPIPLFYLARKCNVDHITIIFLFLDLLFSTVTRIQLRVTVIKKGVFS